MFRLAHPMDHKVTYFWQFYFPFSWQTITVKTTSACFFDRYHVSRLFSTNKSWVWVKIILSPSFILVKKLWLLNFKQTKPQSHKKKGLGKDSKTICFYSFQRNFTKDWFFSFGMIVMLWHNNCILNSFQSWMKICFHK